MAPGTSFGMAIRRVAVAAVVLAGLTVGSAAAAQADEIRDRQTYLRYLNMDAAWAVTEGAGTVVAVLDSGVDASHPDFGDAVVPGTDLTGGGGDGTEALDPHGTAMAGLIGARGRGGDGIRGIAPATSILPVTVNDAATSAEGFRWAADHGADVINFSAATGFTDDPVMRDAIAYALSKDVVIVAGVGNSGGPGVEFPAAYGGVIAVSAVTEGDQLTDKSSYGPEVDLAAPGDVVGLFPGGSYGEGDGGTSNATAITSGVVALVRSQFPDLDAANVVNRIVATGRDIGAAGEDDEFGHGAVDPVAALTADVPGVAENPLGSPGDSGGGTGSETGAPPSIEEPATAPPASGTDPCATAPGPAQSDEPAGPAGPAGALTLDDDCGGFAGISPESSNDAVGVMVAIGLGAVVLVGAAVFVLRRRRPGPSPAYGAPSPPGGHGPGQSGWQPRPPGSDQGGWQAPPGPGPAAGGWQPPPEGGPPSR